MYQETDADLKRVFLQKLEKQDWVRRTERRWWPRLLFHYTDINNAIRILQNGCLYSRGQLENAGGLAVSSGSSVVLAGTDTTIKDCVRLYFRPKTPTQFHAEGVRSKTILAKSMFSDAHCPVPVFFLLDSASILTRNDSLFSDGSLASPKAQIFQTANELENLPWKKIYHNSWFDVEKDRDIVFRRGAEVIVPISLDLEALRYIYCRSEAERETLLFLLPYPLRKRYQRKIVSTTRSTLYFRQHTFLETVQLDSSAVSMNFSPETNSGGPFHLQIDLVFNEQQESFSISDFNLAKYHNWKIPLGEFIPNYSIQIFLDGFLIYANSYVYQEFEIPF